MSRAERKPRWWTLARRSGCDWFELKHPSPDIAHRYAEIIRVEEIIEPSSASAPAGDRSYVDRVRQIAREHGYAVAEHGSRQRDVDLVAVAWTPEAVSSDELIARLLDGIDNVVARGPVEKPHGRVAWALLGPNLAPSYIDLSIIEPPVACSAAAGRAGSGA